MQEASLHSYITIALALTLGANTTVFAGGDADTIEQVIVNGDPLSLPIAAGNTAELLRKQGVQFYSSGGVAKLPVLNGLNDDRVKVLVDGMQATSACANHMNPALSYIDASRANTIEVLAGITPVSAGGDSIAGTISIHSAPPLYARSNEGYLFSGDLGLFYKSNSRNHIETVNVTAATDTLSFTYNGSNDRAESYRDGKGDKVLDTLYRVENHALTLGVRGEDQALIVKLTHQEVPYQGFPNQYMDMVGNVSNGVNLNYLRTFSWGKLNARISWQDVEHEMGFFTAEKPGIMPMLTEGVDKGYTVDIELPLSQQHILRLGNELHRFELDDWWPAVAGSMMMGPNDYVNIHNGRKTRYTLWAESDYRFNDNWKMQNGIRYEKVVTDTGNVQPYNEASMLMMMPNLDAAAATAFNGQDHRQQDDVFDVTLLANFTPDVYKSVEFGYARKTRTPNLYERYSWGRNAMAMTMIGWFGDGNGYAGNSELRPEIAHTISATFNWKGAINSLWALSVTPYYTYVDDYIDAEQIGAFHPRMVMGVTRPLLRFNNIDADLYGITVKGNRQLWDTSHVGKVVLSGRISVTEGERHRDNSDLYQIAPLNLNLTLEQTLNNWSNSLEVEWMDNKRKVDGLRLENTTDSFTLIHLSTQYVWQPLTLRLGVRNLLDENYELPLGGVSLAQWSADGMAGDFAPLAGQGRSIEAGIIYSF